MTALPTGRPGQMLAVALAAVAMVLVWLGVISPILGWYADRSERLAEHRILSARMQSVADSAPALQQQLASADAAPPARTMFAGATDAVAEAALQQAVQDIAAHAGATVSSTEVLPASPMGDYRRIGLRVTVSGSWPVLVGMLASTLQATPRMLVDDLQLRQTQALGARGPHPMEARLIVVAFSAVSPTAR